jgi:hypothetical protein|tara:strand:+ start:11954 stop:12262 length:309 start_codon:yes stop_codon:yes gene_type:complete
MMKKERISEFFTWKQNKNITVSLAIFFSLIGFCLGNLISTWLSLFFIWNGLAAFFILIGLELINSLITNPFSKRGSYFLLYLLLIKRGFFFGLLVDGFKVGS